MNRYFLFGGTDDDTGGGWEDFMGDYSHPGDAVAEGERYLRGRPESWYHVVDSTNGEIL